MSTQGGGRPVFTRPPAHTPATRNCPSDRLCARPDTPRPTPPAHASTHPATCAPARRRRGARRHGMPWRELSAQTLAPCCRNFPRSPPLEPLRLALAASTGPSLAGGCATLLSRQSKVTTAPPPAWPKFGRKTANLAEFGPVSTEFVQDSADYGPNFPEFVRSCADLVSSSADIGPNLVDSKPSLAEME